MKSKTVNIKDIAKSSGFRLDPKYYLDKEDKEHEQKIKEIFGSCDKTHTIAENVYNDIKSLKGQVKAKEKYIKILEAENKALRKKVGLIDHACRRKVRFKSYRSAVCENCDGWHIGHSSGKKGFEVWGTKTFKKGEEE
jgi:regulator of replication initiation timing